MPDFNDPLSIFAAIAAALGAKNWLFLAAGAIVLAVWAARSFGAQYIPFLKTDRGGAALVLFSGVLTAAAQVIFGGFSWQALVDGVMAALVAAGGFSAVKKVFYPSDKPAAPPAA